MGDVMGDINSRRGRVEGMEARANGSQAIKGVVPLAEMFGYATSLRSKTQGRGIYTMQFSHYEPVPKSISEEIMEGKPTTLTASNPFAMGLFQNQQVTVELCDDLPGIVMCGALKNIYAIGAGYYSNSENMSATFMQHAHAEMQRYLVDHGAKSETAELACGLGDLILTCTNDTSRNFRCGVWLREGKSIEEITSQLKTVEGLTALLNADTESYKLLHGIQDLVASHSK
jgi:hypothetical protein